MRRKRTHYPELTPLEGRSLLTVVGLNVTTRPASLPTNGGTASVTVVATFTDTTPATTPALSYKVSDEYGQSQPVGLVTPIRQRGGSYSISLPVDLETEVRAGDQDGRRYTVSVTVKDDRASRTKSAVVVVPPARPAPVLNGTLTGGYFIPKEDMRAADAPLRVALDGSGTVLGLGRVTMTGSLDFGGFRVSGVPDVTGAVTLANARGRVTILLSGSGGQSQVPGSRFRLNASVLSGTGDYAGLRGAGGVDARFGGNAIRCITTPCPVGGSLTLALLLKPPVR